MFQFKSLLSKLGLVIVILLLVLVSVKSLQTVVKQNKKIQNLENTIYVSQEEISFYKDENNKLHTKNNVLTIDYKTIQNSNNELIKTVEEQRKQLKIKEKDVKIVTVNVNTIDTVVNTVVKDSCYTYEDLYNEFIFCKDTSSIKIVDTTSQIIYNKRFIPNRSKIFFIRWFQKRQIIQEIDITHSNPLIRTTDNKTIINKNQR